eukprot:2870728-Amphidinium_carterae.1
MCTSQLIQELPRAIVAHRITVSMFPREACVRGRDGATWQTTAQHEGIPLGLKGDSAPPKKVDMVSIQS